MAETLAATVVIPTFNGERYLGEILDALRGQEGVAGFEVLVIDSGSTDRTLEIVRSYPEVRLHEIPNVEFGHGRTRNLGARLAKGEIVAYLSHDAIPAHTRWLSELIRPFEIGPRLVAVMGKQIPRPNCFPLMRYEIEGVFAQFGPDFGTTVFAQPEFENPAVLPAITFYSDVNSATRRSFVTGVIPYRDVPYAEDQMFGRDLIDAGFWKAYSGAASVIHSNDVTYAEFGRRIFDETVGLRRLGDGIPPLGRLSVLRLTIRGSLGDARRILRDRRIGRKRKLRWLAITPPYHYRKWSSYRAASIVDLEDEAAVQRGSLEHSRKA